MHDPLLGRCCKKVGRPVGGRPSCKLSYQKKPLLADALAQAVGHGGHGILGYRAARAAGIAAIVERVARVVVLGVVRAEKYELPVLGKIRIIK